MAQQHLNFGSAINDGTGDQLRSGAQKIENNFTDLYGQIGAVNGIAQLDGGGKVPVAQLPAAIIGAISYQGTWNATTNSPAIASGVGTKGFYYKVATAGTATVDGISQWNASDLIVFNGTTWDKVDGLSSEVLSVAGRTGAVTLAQADIAGLTTASVPAFAGLSLTGFEKINLNAVAAPTPASGTGLQIVGVDAASIRYEADAFGGSAFFTARRANGTGAAPTAIAANDEIGAYNFAGYFVTGGPGYSTAGASIKAIATENWTSTAHGLKAQIFVTPNGATTAVLAAEFDQDGTLTGAAAIKSSSPSAGIGYATGAGGAVTQATNKSTGVTLNKVTGQITTHNASLVNNTAVGFTLTNSAIGATDEVVFWIVSGATLNSYQWGVDAVAAWSCHLWYKQLSGGALAEAIVFGFAVRKSVIV
jgi:hypothetical protein